MLVDLGYYFPVPHPPGVGIAVAIAFAGTTLDAANEYVGAVFRITKAGTIKKINIPMGAVTTGATLPVTIEGVSVTTGLPDGVPLTNGSTTLVVTPGDANTLMQATFATGPTVTRGQLIVLKIANPAASFGNMVINRGLATGITPYHFPYTVTALPTAAKSSVIPCFGLEYSDGSYAYMPGILPCSIASTSATISTSTTPDEVGLKFKFPAAVKVSGIWANLTVTIGTALFDIVLYDADGTTVLTSISIDGDQLSSTNSATMFFTFDEDVALAGDTFYRVVFKPTTTNAMSSRYCTVPSAAVMDAMEGGRDFHKTQRTDAGAWTDVLTDRPWVGVLVSAMDDGAGGGRANLMVGLH